MEAGRRLPQEMEEASLRLWPSYAKISKKLPFDLEWFTVFGKNAPQPLSGPLPPLGLLDFDSTMKFRETALEQFRSHGQGASVVLDWMIRTLLNSLMADSAARIFLPKTETGPFVLDDLLPLSAVEPTGQAKLPLNRTYLVAPAWNNRETAEALRRASELPMEALGGGAPVGVYLRELNLAIVDAAPHESLCCRFLGRGAVVLDAYSLRDLAPVIRTDGTDWFVTEAGGDETYCPVLEPRMAALYRLALERYCPDLLSTQREKR